MWQRVLKVIWASSLLNFCNFYSCILYLKCPRDMLLLQGQYLENGATKRKNKSTFFSRTFKVGESKVTLFFDFMLSEPSYGHFVILSQGHGHNFQQNGQISGTEYWNEKIRALSFLQLLKFEKAKWPYFCILCFLSRDMAIFWFCPGDMLFHKMAISRKRGSETKK